jgi:hypothetical protein
MNPTFKSPVWHLNVLRVHLTNLESCHDWERRLTRKGEWERNTKEKNKVYWEEVKYSDRGRPAVTKRRHIVKGGKDCSELQNGTELNGWAERYDAVACHAIYELQWRIVRGRGPIKQERNKLDTAVTIQSKVNHVWNINRLILRIYILCRQMYTVLCYLIQFLLNAAQHVSSLYKAHLQGLFRWNYNSYIIGI